jgi:hypothetical protein
MDARTIIEFGQQKIRNLPIPKEYFIKLSAWLGYELWQASLGWDDCSFIQTSI